MSNKTYKVNDFVEAIKNSKGVISVIASRMGCGRATVYRFINDSPTVKQAIEDERESMKDFAENKLFQHINNNNIPALLFYLKTQAQDRGYIEKLRIEGNIQLTIINDAIKALEEAGVDPVETFQELINQAKQAKHVSADISE